MNYIQCYRNLLSGIDKERCFRSTTSSVKPYPPQQLLSLVCYHYSVKLMCLLRFRTIYHTCVMHALVNAKVGFMQCCINTHGFTQSCTVILLILYSQISRHWSVADSLWYISASCTAAQSCLSPSVGLHSTYPCPGWLNGPSLWAG